MRRDGRPPRGDPGRIALIHAVYAAGWALISLMVGGVSPWPAGAILVFAAVLAFGAARAIRRQPAVALEPAVGRWVRRVNLVTAVAAAGYAWVLTETGHDAQAVAAVLVLLGLHFVPLWLLLRRRSLLAMGAALAAIGVMVWTAPAAAASGAFFAALVFAGNSTRLLFRAPEPA